MLTPRDLPDLADPEMWHRRLFYCVVVSESCCLGMPWRYSINAFVTVVNYLKGASERSFHLTDYSSFRDDNYLLPSSGIVCSLTDTATDNKLKMSFGKGKTVPHLRTRLFWMNESSTLAKTGPSEIEDQHEWRVSRKISQDMSTTSFARVSV